MIGDKNNSKLKYDMNFYYNAFGRRLSDDAVGIIFEEIYEEKVGNRERCIN